MTQDPVVVVIHYQAQPGQGTRASTELRALIREVVALEPDCLGIRLHVDANDPSRFLLYERWTSRAAYAGPHMPPPHLGAAAPQPHRRSFGGPLSRRGLHW